jgi:S-adenosylmethionine synthetase
MTLVLGRLPAKAPDEWEVEIVERKGIGHPDTISDALAERLSAALSRLYLDRFGTILHHNLDKALLRAGVSRPAFGGGDVLAPVEIYFAGRAVTYVDDIVLPIEQLAVEESRAWFMRNMHAFEPDRHLEVRCLVRPGSRELTDLFDRDRQGGGRYANDTSYGVGYAPLSKLERLVLDVEGRLNGAESKRRHPEWGEDIKIMAVRRGGAIDITLACAFVDRHIADMAAYQDGKAALAAEVQTLCRELADVEATVAVNAADGDSPKAIYLTVTGTSAESGDDGEVGRGNRVNGLITPYRPMSLEALAGKNPVSHVGKLYNLAATRVAQAAVDRIPEVRAAQCLMVSRIGERVDRPPLVDVKLDLPEAIPPTHVRPVIADIVETELGDLDRLTERLVAGDVAIY